MANKELLKVIDSWLDQYSLCCADIFKHHHTLECEASNYRNLIVTLLYNEFGLNSLSIAKLIGMNQSNVSKYVRLGNEYIYLNDWYCKYLSLFNHIKETL